MFSLPFEYIDGEIKRDIIKKLSIKPRDETLVEPYYLFETRKDEVLLPLGEWSEYYEEFPNEYKYTRTSCIFQKELLTPATDPSKRGRDQRTVSLEAIHQLNTFHTCFLALHTGFGKTCMGVYLSCYYNYKTVILVHSDDVKKQWVEAIKKFSDAKVQIVKGDDPLDPKADIYIIGIVKCSKFNMKRQMFSHIGIVIVDEAHLVTVSTFTVVLKKFMPKYLIGLSATPDRKDGMHKLFYPYFGKPKTFIQRFEVRSQFKVIKYQTDFKPELVIEYVPYFKKVTVNPTKKQNSIESQKDRQKFIANIAQKHPERDILIMCNRQINTQGIYDCLRENGEDVDCYYGSMKKYNTDCHILVAGMDKIGVGFDDPKNRTLIIIASATDDVRQYEGRIRSDDCLLYHIVDYDLSYERKWDKCEKWYRKRGAVVEIRGCEHPIDEWETEKDIHPVPIVPKQRFTRPIK
jgi:superfamily II DNA or RNA helicase